MSRSGVLVTSGDILHLHDINNLHLHTHPASADINMSWILHNLVLPRGSMMMIGILKLATGALTGLSLTLAKYTQAADPQTQTDINHVCIL